MRALVLLAALLVLATPATLRAAGPGPSCHCFRDRSFDPEHPELTDPYIRATTRNSLLSATFGVPKRDIVQAEMTGTSPEDLWIAHWVAARSGEPAAALLGRRREKPSWGAVLAAVPGAKLGSEFAGAIARGVPDDRLAALAVADVLTRRVHADPAALAALEQSGASPADAIVACVLAVRLHRPATDVWQPVAARKKSWGTVLNEAGIAPPDMDAVVRAIVR